MKRINKCLGLIGLSLLLTMPLTQAQSTGRPRHGSRHPAAIHQIAWRMSFAAAQSEAKRTGKPMMVDFGATWCKPCHLLDRTTWVNPKVVAESAKWIPVKIDVDQDRQSALDYRVSGFPTVLFLQPNGDMITNIIGYYDAPATLKVMQEAYVDVRHR